ncbi:hypothetical protein SAMN05444166_8491 [Singulisphaera sp. GP187]|nr:hypothetical protein SAMN05444166_8491 [Singulisphaera sp. GP187]
MHTNLPWYVWAAAFRLFLAAIRSNKGPSATTIMGCGDTVVLGPAPARSYVMINTPLSSQCIPFADWPIAYRFTSENYNVLNSETLASIRPLAAAAAQELARRHDLIRLMNTVRSNMPMPGWVRTEIDPSDLEKTRSWLRSRPIPAEDDVFVEWSASDGGAAIVKWGTLCEFFDDFWYPFEVVLVTDDSSGWRLLFGPNDEVRWRGRKE